MCATTRCVLPHMCCHETCTLHNTSKRGPHKHVTGMHCSIVVVPCKITHVKMKLQLSGTVLTYGTYTNTFNIKYVVTELNLPADVNTNTGSTQNCLNNHNITCKSKKTYS